MNDVSQVSTASWFGKLPTQGDFTRGGVDGPVERALTAWLTSAVEDGGGSIPADPVRFVITPPGESTVVGTWVASGDSVGRSFPLCAWIHVPADVERVHWSLLVGYYTPFLSAAESVLLRCRELGSEAIGPSLQNLTLPHESELPALLATSREAMESERLSSFAARNFQSAQLQTLPYALTVLQRALELREPELTLDMPAADLRDVFSWLELALVMLAQHDRPSCIAWVPAAGRLLLCVDGLPAQLLAYLIAPDHRGTRRWPLTTTSIEAAASACASLDPRIVQALESDATLGQLLELTRMQSP